MKTINQLHDFPTFTEAKQAAEELKNADPDNWKYEAITIKSSNKHVIAVYDEIRFIGYW